MSKRLEGIRVAILAADGVERVELEQPRQTVVDAGAEVTLLSLEDGEIQSMDGDIEPSKTFTVDRTVGDASIDEYDALLLPGGVANPDTLRGDEAAVAFVGDFVRAGKPVSVICHGPWTLLEAGVVDGRTLTSYPSIRTDLRNAGATVVDEEVAVDGNLLSSRDPGDLDAFCARTVDHFAPG